MTDYNFDQVVARRGTGSAKWAQYEEDVLPMWVADMDFQVAPAITEALQARVSHGIFGYTMPPEALKQAIVGRLADAYAWQVQPEEIVFIPGVIPGINMAARATAQDGAVMIQPPVYHPFHSIHEWSGTGHQEAPLVYTETDDGFTYSIDFEALEAAMTPETRMFLLCQPHNPVGRVWTRDELAQLVAICERHDVAICSDEIHCDLILGDVPHTPTATLSEAAAARTITLMAPSKTFNVPGLGFSFAVIQDAALRQQFVEAGMGIVTAQMGGQTMSFINMMGHTAATAAYQDGWDWLGAALDYMRANRDYAQAYIAEHMPQIKTATLEGTYLLWLDCRALDLPSPPGAWFLAQAQVALNEGGMFGEEGAGFVRMNLATPRALLERGLERMCDALQTVQG